jgi:hypothetical protein
MQQKTETTRDRRNLNAARVIVSTVGILCGISGIEHSYFETLQRNVATGGIVVDAIGPASLWW